MLLPQKDVTRSQRHEICHIYFTQNGTWLSITNVGNNHYFLSTRTFSVPTHAQSSALKILSFKVQSKFYFLHDFSLEDYTLRSIFPPLDSPC